MNKDIVKEEIEKKLQKYGVATRMEVSSANSSDKAIEYYMEKVAEDLIEELSTYVEEEKRKAVEGFVEFIKEKNDPEKFITLRDAEQYLGGEHE